jgi:hypothetical protein
VHFVSGLMAKRVPSSSNYGRDSISSRRTCTRDAEAWRTQAGQSIGGVSPEQDYRVTQTCQRMSRSSTANTIKLGVHATIIPSKKAWVRSITCPL